MNKKERSNDALEHTEEMAKLYKEEIKNSIDNSVVYRDSAEIHSSGSPVISLEQTDTVSSIFKHNKGKVGILNFASYKHAGGGFLRGSMAQEESLCASSFLYNVLSKFEDYYEYNMNHLNDSLYTNACIYSPDIIFINGSKIYKVDVFTCAAPNNCKRNLISPAVNSSHLESRIKFLREIISNYNIDVLILGAFGCGVFSQDALEVASLFKKYFSDCNAKQVVYAIPDAKNYNKFRSVFNS